jgi:hypothetical protein
VTYDDIAKQRILPPSPPLPFPHTPLGRKRKRKGRKAFSAFFHLLFFFPLGSPPSYLCLTLFFPRSLDSTPPPVPSEVELRNIKKSFFLIAREKPCNKNKTSRAKIRKATRERERKKSFFLPRKQKPAERNSARFFYIFLYFH